METKNSEKKKIPMRAIVFLIVSIAAFFGTKLLMNHLTGQEEGFGTIFILWIFVEVLVILLFIGFGILVPTAEVKQQIARIKKQQFYDECVKNNITALDLAANRQKASLIAANLKCGEIADLDAYFEEGKQLSISARNQAEEAAANAELEKIRKEEQEEYAKLAKYADLYGRDKQVAMLTDMQSAYVRKAHDLREGMKLLAASTQQKELNWATHGGIASGIAGGAAGVAAAVDAQRRNMEIRAKNEANMKALEPGMMAVYGSAYDYDQAARELQPSIDAAKIKLVADTAKEDIFDNLTFGEPTVEISKTGAFTVEVVAGRKQPVVIFDNINAVIDGVVYADLYQNGNLAGSAKLVLPVMGIEEDSKIKGICLSGAKEEVPCEVRFRPCSLWEMEA